MGTTFIEVPARKKAIQPSNWKKKELADAHVGPLHFCQFGCTYCSSNAGLGLRFTKRTTNAAVRNATGRGFDYDATEITLAYANYVELLDAELSACKRKPGRGQTIVYSQLTDGFSPVIVRDGTARKVLDLLIEKSEYRIRVLTKNSVVGKPRWVNYFAKHADRFVVGLSTGTLDNRSGSQVERLTSRPESRIAALHKLQDAGVPTFGMLCPVFPEMLTENRLEELVDAIRPRFCEKIWWEPYNERHGWETVRSCFDEGSWSWNWMTDVFENGNKRRWSEYATELYRRVWRKGVRDGFADKLRYLLYQGDIEPDHAECFRGLNGVLLQSFDKKGGIVNPAFRDLA